MKPILLTSLGLFTCFAMSAQSAQFEGPKTGHSFSNSNLPGSSQSWINPESAGSSDNSYASFGNIAATGGYTDYLMVTDFGFNLPAGAEISGIKVEVECSDPNYRTADYSVRIIKANTIGTEERATGSAFTVFDKNMEYGGAADLWKETWTSADINDNSFGVAIAVQRYASGVATDGRIDDVTIVVYYKFTTLPVSLISFTATKENRSVNLQWNTVSESNMEKYEAERSTNGVNFYSLVTIPSRNLQTAIYSHSDKNPPSGKVYYRLKMEGAAGYIKYSPVLSVHFDKHASVSLSPCPWTKGTDLSISNPGKELLRLQFYNATGQMISTVITSSDKVATDNLVNKEGKFYYNVFNSRNELLGSGTLIIQ